MQAAPAFGIGFFELVICLGVPFVLAVVTAVVIAVAVGSKRKDQ